MKFLLYLKVYVVGLVGMVVVDIIWIKFIMGGFYDTSLGPLARRAGESFSPRILPSLLVWMLIALGVLLFVLPKMESKGSPIEGVLWGALFGLVLYGVYDLTNYAILARWPISMTILDIIWGTILCGVTALFMKALLKLFS
jgi:uncharacterized membrane protein